MRLYNNDYADYRMYKVEFFVDNWDTRYSYTEDIVIDISNDNYDDNDDFISDLFKLIEQRYNMTFVYKIRITELYDFGGHIYRTHYIKEGEKITHEKNEIYEIK